MARIKICGITNAEDAQRAAAYGAWAVGFIFYKKSPRYVSPSKVRKIVETLPPFVTPVGVFVDAGEGAVREICKVTRITTVQFHGKETVNFCMRFKDFKIIKAFQVREDRDWASVEKYRVDAFLFDTHHENLKGGTGQTFPWKVLEGKKFPKPVILAGGLEPENVGEAIRLLNPYAVDVSSAVEDSPGHKNPARLTAFIQAVHPYGI